MKNMKNKILFPLSMLLLVATTVACGGSETAAEPADGPSATESASGFAVKDGQWQIKGSGKTLEPRPRQENGLEIVGDVFLNGKAETKDGVFYWLAVQPANEGFGRTGIYLYDEGNEFYDFVPTGEEGSDSEAEIFSVEFSPDGAWMIVNHDGTFEVYSGPVAREEVTAFHNAATPAFWIDSMRFVYSARLGKVGDAGLRSSVLLVDARTMESTILKKATETSEFLAGIRSTGITDQENEIVSANDKNAINVTEFYVKSAKDWDSDKVEARNLTVKLP